MQTQPEIQFTGGGVTAPAGFTASGVLCGIKRGRTTADTALIYSERPCRAAGLFTQNRVQAECVKLTRRNIAGGRIQAVVANSGNANCCTGRQGAEAALRTAESAAAALGIQPETVAVCSTGVIGQPFPVEKIEAKMDALKAGLSREGHEAARAAIMTTDTRYKECAVRTEIGGRTVTIGAMCKGSGMININLGTMLSFVTTDCAVSLPMLRKALRDSAAGTYNCVSIDGDTSTNDTLLILANGMAGNAEIVSDGDDYGRFFAALNALNTVMAKKIASDGEGAGRLVECVVRGATDVATARALAKSVISSNLVKAAMFGGDANWGRILCAMGYSGCEFDYEKACVYFMRGEDAGGGCSDCAADNVATGENGADCAVSGCAADIAAASALSDNGGAPCGGCADCADKDSRAAVCAASAENGGCSDCAANNVAAGENGDCVQVFDHGSPLDFDEEKASRILSGRAVRILVTLEDGRAEGRAWGCDLTYDYVKINGDYRT